MYDNNNKKKETAEGYGILYVSSMPHIQLQQHPLKIAQNISRRPLISTLCQKNTREHRAFCLRETFACSVYSKRK